MEVALNCSKAKWRQSSIDGIKVESGLCCRGALGEKKNCLQCYWQSLFYFFFFTNPCHHESHYPDLKLSEFLIVMYSNDHTLWILSWTQEKEMLMNHPGSLLVYRDHLKPRNSIISFWSYFKSVSYSLILFTRYSVMLGL